MRGARYTGPKKGAENPKFPKITKAKPTRILFWSFLPPKAEYELWANEMRLIDTLASYLVTLKPQSKLALCPDDLLEPPNPYT
jgi:hypothetical protein